MFIQYPRAWLEPRKVLFTLHWSADEGQVNSLLIEDPSQHCKTRLHCRGDSVTIVHDLFSAILSLLIPFNSAAKISMPVKSGFTGFEEDEKTVEH